MAASGTVNTAQKYWRTFWLTPEHTLDGFLSQDLSFLDVSLAAAAAWTEMKLFVELFSLTEDAEHAKQHY